MSQDNAPNGTLTLRTVAMPADVNVNGDIFGGWVLSQMDIAGGIHAIEEASGRVTTVSVNEMTFVRPVKVGDVLCVYTSVERLGNTSIAIGLEAWALRQITGEREKVTEGVFTYVAIDADGRPRPVKG
ncbi:acyl-CoA thioesterase [Alisedimentitalea sp. MJ-SS2]|uniref:acyl-CoA thioesterase n=1 Tax=Aliisedimentitalea sp. MJ-SS2 TaxID=3049795 RepID=UPI002911C939|nr:acyl-CoA thioesterase [Alisedimentitalea sp. MJ-SS2]MDU8927480.1 acyl-CoA thioesterase [Alisedimentitalea sp. MJ-SS2]